MSLANAEIPNNNNLYCNTLSCQNVVLGDASTSSEFFDENSFVSSIEDTSGNQFVLVPNQNSNKYTRIGNTVLFSINLKWSSKGSAVAGDIVEIKLPFNVGPIYTVGPSFSVSYVEGVSFPSGLYASGLTSGDKLRLGTINVSDTVYAKVSDLSASGAISISGFYNLK